MAKIQVTGKYCTVTLSEPDEDGEYDWMAWCGEAADAIRPLDEAVGHAEMHVDAPWTSGNPRLHREGMS